MHNIFKKKKNNANNSNRNRHNGGPSFGSFSSSTSSSSSSSTNKASRTNFGYRNVNSHLKNGNLISSTNDGNQSPLSTSVDSVNGTRSSSHNLHGPSNSKLFRKYFLFDS